MELKFFTSVPDTDILNAYFVVIFGDKYIGKTAVPDNNHEYNGA